jgi:cytochrome P450
MWRVLQHQLPPGLRLPATTQTFAFWKWPFSYLEWCRSRYGSRFTLRATNYPPLVFLSDLNDVKAMLAAPADVLHPGEGGETITPIVGGGSFMLLERDEHLSGRKLILPFFHSRVVQEHTNLVTDVVQREVGVWPRGITFALYPRLRATGCSRCFR